MKGKISLFLTIILAELIVFNQFLASAAASTTYNIKQDGSGNFTSIQACADNARAGDTCLVYPGTYPEHVKTKFGGTDESNRVNFKAQTQGLVIMQGFHILQPYITVEGFYITSTATTPYGGSKNAYITVSNETGLGGLPTGITANYCKIFNNTIEDGKEATLGITLGSTSGGAPPDNCLVKGNTIKNLRDNVLITQGSYHRFEDNIFQRVNNMNFIYLSGKFHIFIHNIFLEGNKVEGLGIHPDWVQVFADRGMDSVGHLFEENYIEGLEPPMQAANINSGYSVSKPDVLPDIRDITFRRNIFANIGNNFYAQTPGMVFDHNTFYRLAYAQRGLGFGGNLTRGEASRATLTNNAFVAGGDARSNDIKGFYSLTGAQLTVENIAILVTGEPRDGPIANALSVDMSERGYLSNHFITDAGKAIDNLSKFVIDTNLQTLIVKCADGSPPPDCLDGNEPIYENGPVVPSAPYRLAAYNALQQTIALDNKLKSTSRADYNFVAGYAADGYPAKRSDGCGAGKGIFTAFNFCEAHGINGGDPKFISISNLLGPDGKIFTIDDGLKPLPGSPLCGNGEAGSDIGAYSCNPSVVFSGGSSPPGAPNGLRINP